MERQDWSSTPSPQTNTRTGHQRHRRWLIGQPWRSLWSAGVEGVGRKQNTRIHPSAPDTSQAATFRKGRPQESTRLFRHVFCPLWEYPHQHFFWKGSLGHRTQPGNAFLPLSFINFPKYFASESCVCLGPCVVSCATHFSTAISQPWCSPPCLFGSRPTRTPQSFPSTYGNVPQQFPANSEFPRPLRRFIALRVGRRRMKLTATLGLL